MFRRETRSTTAAAVKGVQIQNENAVYPTQARKELREVTQVAQQKPKKQDADNLESMDWEETPYDFDSTKDPDMCGEYCKDIFLNEMTREKKWIVTQRLTDRKRIKMRKTCVDWLIEICHAWSLATDTLFVAVLYFDKSLRCKTWKLDEMQLLAGTCLIIAAKMEEVHAIPLDDLVELVPDMNIDREMVKTYEKNILTSLKYEMTASHIMLFIRRWNTVSSVDHKTHNLSKYLATLVLRFQKYCMYPQSLLAAAVSLVAKRCAGVKDPWTKTDVFYSGYTLTDLENAVYFVCNAITAVNNYVRLNPAVVNTHKCPAAFKAYDHAKTNHISKSSCLQGQWITNYSFRNDTALEI